MNTPLNPWICTENLECNRNPLMLAPFGVDDGGGGGKFKGSGLNPLVLPQKDFIYHLVRYMPYCFVSCPIAWHWESLPSKQVWQWPAAHFTFLCFHLKTCSLISWSSSVRVWPDGRANPWPAPKTLPHWNSYLQFYTGAWMIPQWVDIYVAKVTFLLKIKIEI